MNHFMETQMAFTESKSLNLETTILLSSTRRASTRELAYKIPIQEQFVTVIPHQLREVLPFVLLHPDKGSQACLFILAATARMLLQSDTVSTLSTGASMSIVCLQSINTHMGIYLDLLLKQDLNSDVSYRNKTV